MFLVLITTRDDVESFWNGVVLFFKEKSLKIDIEEIKARSTKFGGKPTKLIWWQKVGGELLFLSLKAGGRVKAMPTIPKKSR